MSCYTSHTDDLRDITSGSISYGRVYGVKWASVDIALLASMISSITLFTSARDAGSQTMSFKNKQSNNF